MASWSGNDTVDRSRLGARPMLRDPGVPATGALNCESRPLSRQGPRQGRLSSDPGSRIGDVEMTDAGRLGEGFHQAGAGAAVPLPGQVGLVVPAGLPCLHDHHMVGVVAVLQRLDADADPMRAAVRPALRCRLSTLDEETSRCPHTQGTTPRRRPVPRLPRCMSRLRSAARERAVVGARLRQDRPEECDQL